MNIAKILGNDSYYQLNKILIEKLKSVSSAMYLTHLIDIREYLRGKNQLREDESFFCLQEKVKEKLYFSTYEQNQFVKQLVEMNLIEVKKEGLPARYYFYVLDEEILKCLKN